MNAEDATNLIGVAGAAAMAVAWGFGWLGAAHANRRMYRAVRAQRFDDRELHGEPDDPDPQLVRDR
ncbi:MAG: hypothetical protein AB7G37_11160 [Solirubrobacteraceae bacterium]